MSARQLSQQVSCCDQGGGGSSSTTLVDLGPAGQLRLHRHLSLAGEGVREGHTLCVGGGGGGGGGAQQVDEWPDTRRGEARPAQPF